jgi:hypothetical protein
MRVSRLAINVSEAYSSSSDTGENWLGRSASRARLPKWLFATKLRTFPLPARKLPMLPMSPTRRPIVPPSWRSFRMRTSSSLRRHLRGRTPHWRGSGPILQPRLPENCAGSQCAPRRAVSLLSALCGRAGADAGRGDDGVSGISRIRRAPSCLTQGIARSV